MKKIRPLNDRVILRPLSLEEKTERGIYLVNLGDKRNKEAEVIAISENEDKITVGGIVIYDTYNGYVSLKFKGEDCIIVKKENILAIKE